MSAHTVPAVYQHRTLRAVCVRAEISDEDVWLPLSRVTIAPPDPLMRGEAITVTGPATLLREKGLME